MLLRTQKSIKSNIHLKSSKSQAKTTKKKQISCSFSYANIIANQSKMNDKDVKAFSETLKTLKATKIIKLDFTNSKEMSDKGLFWVFEGIRRLPSVHTLIINLARCEKITDIGIKNLAQGIKRLRSLKKFHLSLQGCSQVGDKGLEHLGASLKNQALLRDVDMNISGSYHISDRGIGKILSSFQRPFAIRLLNFELSLLSNITNLTFDNTIKEFKRLTFLEDCGLRSYKCVENFGATRYELTEIANRFPHLKRIKKDFEGCTQLRDQDFISRCEAFCLLTSLQVIQINFASIYQLTDEGLKAIQYFTKNHQLKEFDFNLSRCEEITDQGLIYIANFLEQGPALETIRLNLNK